MQVEHVVMKALSLGLVKGTSILQCMCVSMQGMMPLSRQCGYERMFSGKEVCLYHPHRPLLVGFVTYHRSSRVIVNYFYLPNATKPTNSKVQDSSFMCVG